MGKSRTLRSFRCFYAETCNVKDWEAFCRMTAAGCYLFFCLSYILVYIPHYSRIVIVTSAKSFSCNNQSDTVDGGFLQNSATRNSSFFGTIFHYYQIINHPAIGVSSFMETPSSTTVFLGSNVSAGALGHHDRWQNGACPCWLGGAAEWRAGARGEGRECLVNNRDCEDIVRI